MKKRVKVKIFGKVHGVRFRLSAKEKAQQLGIFGCVENMPDGTVYIEAEGEEEILKKFLSWCRRGPQNASVEKIIFSWFTSLKGYGEFSSVHSTKQIY